MVLMVDEAGLGSYRTAAFLLYGAGGLAWAALGVALARVSTDDGLTA